MTLFKKTVTGLGLGLAIQLGASVIAPSVAAARPALPARDLDAIDRYDVVSYSDPFSPGIERGKAVGVIDATPEQVYRVAADYSRYKDFVPRIFASQIVSDGGEAERVVRLGAELPWPAGTTWVNAKYHWDKLPGNIYRLNFEMVSGSMKRFIGAMYLEPWDKTRTAITYELVAEPKSRAPKSFVNRGARRTAFNFVHALRQRIRDLQIAGYMKKVDAHPAVAATPAALQAPPVLGARTAMPPSRAHSHARSSH